MTASRRYRALLIGNASFPRDPHGLPELHGPAADLKELRQALTDERTGLFASDILDLLDYEVQELRKALYEFFVKSAERDDVLLLYYSGHGKLDLLNKLHLCAHDSETDSLPVTALRYKEDVESLIDESPATTTVTVLDCCYSGAFRGGDLIVNATGRGKCVISSSSATELVPDSTGEDGPSPFTDAFIQGLRLAEAGVPFTVRQLYDHIFQVQAGSGNAMPQLHFSGEGDIAIAGAPSSPPSTLPAPPPPIPFRQRCRGFVRRHWRSLSVASLAAGAALSALLVVLPDDPTPGGDRGVHAVAEAKEDGRPTVFEAARTECAPSEESVRVGDHGRTLTVDRAFAEEDPGIDGDKLNCIFEAIDLPDSVESRMWNTNGYSGQQEAEFNGLSVSWSYSSDVGFDMTVADERPEVGRCLPYDPEAVGDGLSVIDCGDPRAFWEITAQSYEIDAEVDDDGGLLDHQAAYDLCGVRYGAPYFGELWTNWQYVYSSGAVDSMYCTRALGDPDPGSDARTPYIPGDGACFDDGESWWTVDCGSSEAVYEVVGTVELDEAGELSDAEAAEEATCGGDFYWEVTDIEGRTAAILCGSEL
ncbi:caspase family protein [Glycomyces tenuis]|uniref:caspase family protein n=1 Tax=Glycomyces tenuis TaxID=58116 RepID=UPI0004217778|nr:caspase family protein [Glycomyces tenuis]